MKREEEEPPIFPATDLDKVFNDEELMNDSNAIELMLRSWIVDDLDKAKATLKGTLEEIRISDIWEIDAGICREYSECGTQGYIRLVEELIIRYGQDFILSNFGKIIRHRVPEYAYESLDKLSVTDNEKEELDEEKVDFITNYYPAGFAEQKNIPYQKIFKSLKNRGRMSGEILTSQITNIKGEVPDEFIEVIKNEADFQFISLQYGIDKVTKKFVKHLMLQRKELPEWAKKYIGPEELKAYMNEILSEINVEEAAIKFAQEGITREEITHQATIEQGEVTNGDDEPQIG